MPTKPTTDPATKEIARILGQRQPAPPKPLEPLPYEPVTIRKWQPYATSSSLAQGDKGYVTGMYRPDAVKLDGSDFTKAYLEYLNGGRV